MTYGKSHPDTIDVQKQLCLILFDLCYFDESIELARELYETLFQEEGMQSEATLDALNIMILALSYVGKDEEVIEKATKALEISKRLFGENTLIHYSH